MAEATAWASRIVGSAQIDPKTLLDKANPLNFRKHPKAQQEVLSGLLNEVGWLTRIIVNRRNDKLIDGHARVQVAAAENQPWVPVEYVDLSDAEERLVLSLFDATTEMAEVDVEELRTLLGVTNSGHESLQNMLSLMADKHGIDELTADALESPPDVDEEIEAEPVHENGVISEGVEEDHEDVPKAEPKPESPVSEEIEGRILCCPQCEFEWIDEEGGGPHAKQAKTKEKSSY